MKKTRIAAALLAAAMLAGVTGCEDENPVSAPPDAPLVTTPAATTTVDPDENAATDQKVEEISSKDYTPDGNAGKIRYLGYYDLAGDQKSSEPYLIFHSDQYGGEIEYISCSSGGAYFDALGTMIAADDSPDLVLYEWLSFPGGMSKGMYEPLDEYFDVDTELWKGMKKTIDDFEYKGKHYYYPFRLRTYFALNYNRRTIEEAGLKDPYELYKEGNWTWDTWRDMMISFCNLSEDNIGYISAADVLVSIVATTGVNFVDVQPDGTSVNNLADPSVLRAMQFIEDLYRYGLMHQKQLGDWVPPDLWATNSDRALFLGLEPSWCYESATSKVQNPKGVENDIHDTISDFAFVPFPRDPNADKYYQACDSYGYMVPKGAKNIKGAVDWIYCNRVYETDENVIARTREQHLHPDVITYVDGKFAGERKWQMMWDESVYDTMLDLTDPTIFEFNFDNCFGFTTELSTTIIGSMLDEVGFNGGSYSQLSNQYIPVVDDIINGVR